MGHRLALESGRLDVDAVLEELSFAELVDWAAYFEIVQPQRPNDEQVPRAMHWKDMQATFRAIGKRRKRK